MLVLSRKPKERLVLKTPEGQRIEVVICQVQRSKVRVGIQAPREVVIERKELER